MTADLDRLLAGAREGAGGCLIRRGAALAYVVERAGDMRTVRVSGVAAESGFRFAALHQMLSPFLAGLNRLPSPQRHALRGALGLARGPNPDRFLVGLAVLRVLADAAADRPLLIVIDDAQWLDQASAEVFAFVARRLGSEPIAMVVDGPPRRSTGIALGHSALGHSALGHSRTARARTVLTATVDPRPHAITRLRDGLVVRDTEGYPAAVHMLRPVITALLAGRPAGADAELYALACTTAGDLLDDDVQRALADRWVRAERDRTGPGSLPQALSAMARCEALAGRPTSAAAGGGDEPEASSAVSSTLTIVDLAAGRYSAALGHALDVWRDDPPEHGTRILPDLVEAASRTGDRAAATAALDRLAERALASGTPLAFGLLARSRALLADGTVADGLYRDARAHLEQTGPRPQIARTHLLHGEWLRRRRRHRDAREQLVAAADMFEAMGMEAFLRRTRAELRATGERAGKRAGATDNHLTPQECQVAQLVADGLTNREIATQLFISANTVEYHLQKVFRKFAVTSRTQLARVVLTAKPPALA